MTRPSALVDWRRGGEQGDADLAARALAEQVELVSPIADAFTFVGREQVRGLLRLGTSLAGERHLMREPLRHALRVTACGVPDLAPAAPRSGPARRGPAVPSAGASSPATAGVQPLSDQTDEGFGRQPQVTAPGGLLLTIDELEPDRGRVIERSLTIRLLQSGDGGQGMTQVLPGATSASARTPTPSGVVARAMTTWLRALGR